MAEAVEIIDNAVEENNNEVMLTNCFPNLCPNMIGQLVRSGQMDLVQMVKHLSGLEVEKQRKAIFEEAKALMQKPENAEANIETKQISSSQFDKYTSKFNVEEFVALIPNPEGTFNIPRTIDYRNRDYIERFFMNRYPSIYKTAISDMVSYHANQRKEEYNTLVKIDEQLALAVQSGLHVMKCRRKPTPLNHPPKEDILMLQELAYIEHRAEILDYVQKKKQDEAQRRQYAIDNGLTLTCQCCFMEGLMIEEAFTCDKDCSFCAECIQKSCELKLGEENIKFPCLADCGSQFAWTTLQAALPPTLFSKLSQRCTESEIRAAGIKLDSCPSCNFTNIIDEQYTSFQCLNPDCMKETCRLCKEPSHLPLRCNEVEKDEEVKARLHIENKMTDAMLRTCWRCNRKFIKDEDGCNKITCVCGALSCYICNKPVHNYEHFNGLGGDKHHLCPLYSDMVALHQKEVANAAEQAKKEVDQEKLKIDPSAGLNEYYEDKRKNTNLPRWMEALDDILLHLQQEEPRLEQIEHLQANRLAQGLPIINIMGPRALRIIMPPVEQPPPAHRQVPDLLRLTVHRPARLQLRYNIPPPIAPVRTQANRPPQPPAEGPPNVGMGAFQGHLPPPPVQLRYNTFAQPPRAPVRTQVNRPAQQPDRGPPIIDMGHFPVHFLPPPVEQPPPAQVPVPAQRQLPATVSRHLDIFPLRPLLAPERTQRVRQHPHLPVRVPQFNNIQHGPVHLQAAKQAQARKPAATVTRRSLENAAAGPSQKRLTLRTSTHTPATVEQPEAGPVQVRRTAPAKPPNGAKAKQVQARSAKPSGRGATGPVFLDLAQRKK